MDLEKNETKSGRNVLQRRGLKAGRKKRLTA